MPDVATSIAWDCLSLFIQYLAPQSGNIDVASRANKPAVIKA